MQLLLLRRNSRTIALVQPGLTVGWLAGWLAHEMRVNFIFLKYIIDQILKLLLCLTKVTALLEQYECV